jgi:hypothetical protein
MAMAVEIKLTQRLVDGLDFDKPILRLDGHGRPVYGKPNKGQREWRLRDTELPGLQLRITPGSIGWYDLLKVLDARSRHELSTLVASPSHRQDWDTYFEDPTTADAICVRLDRKSQVIELKRTAHA